MAKLQRFYSPSQLSGVLKTSKDDSGNIEYNENGFPKRSLDIASIYKKHAAKNKFGGNVATDARTVLMNAGTQIHEYVESTLRFVNKNYNSGQASSIESAIRQGMVESEKHLTHHVARHYKPMANQAIRKIVSETHGIDLHNATGPTATTERGDILFAAEQDLYSVLDQEKGLGVHGKPDSVYYDKKTNTVKIFDQKATTMFIGNKDGGMTKYTSGFQSEIYPILVHDNFEKLFGFERPEGVKYEMSYVVIPMSERDANKGNISTKTQYYDHSDLQKIKANLINEISKIESVKQKLIRHEQIGGSDYVRQYISSILGPSNCKPGNCGVCSMKLICPNREYQELVDEINSGVYTDKTDKSGLNYTVRNESIEKDMDISTDYKAAMDDIAASKKRAQSRGNKINNIINKEYESYAALFPRIHNTLSDNIREPTDTKGVGQQFAAALGSQEGIPSSILDKDLHPRWMNQKYGQQFAEHIESFAKNIVADISSQFSISPKALTDTVMERVFHSKKLAQELDDIVTTTVKDHFMLRSKISYINGDDVHRVIDNIGGYLKDTKLIETIGQHVQMSTIAAIEQSSGSLESFMKAKGIYQKQGQSKAEALRWYLSKKGNYEESVQSTFEKIHNSPSFRGVLSKFSLSEKRFPLPMLMASMLLSYAGAQTMAQTQANLAINKAEDYRRYQNEEIPEAGHAGVMSMAYRLVSSAFGSGFQKFRTTYQDIANRTLMNNRLFKMFKDATAKAIVKREDLTLEGNIVQKFIEMPTSVKVAAAIGFTAAAALPIIKSKREIGKKEEERKKRLKRVKYAKAKTTGDSTSYQKSSDLRYGYKAHTGFGSPFNPGVFEALFVGINRIAARELPEAIEKMASYAGKVEEFFVDKVKGAVSTVRKSANAMTIENINKNHVNAVLTKQYEKMETLRSGEMRTLEVAKAQREADFHTFGVERANTSTKRLASQMKAIGAQAEMAPDHITRDLERKAADAAFHDSQILTTPSARQNEPLVYKITRPISRTDASILPKQVEKDVVSIEPKTIAHASKMVPKAVAKSNSKSPRIPGNIRVTEPRSSKELLVPKKKHSRLQSVRNDITNFFHNPYRTSKDIAVVAKAKVTNVKADDIGRIARTNWGKEAIGFALTDAPGMWHNRSQISHTVESAAHAPAVAAVTHSANTAKRSSYEEYRAATRAERQVSNKASMNENRKRFRRQSPFV